MLLQGVSRLGKRHYLFSPRFCRRFLSRCASSDGYFIHPKTTTSLHLQKRSVQQTRIYSSSSVENGLPHDLGGRLSAFGPIPDTTQDLLAWEQQCHSLFAVLASKSIISTDGLRRAIESLAPEQYDSWSYYEKWSAGMAILLLENGIVTQNELQYALFGDHKSSHSTQGPAFQVGDAVRVKQHTSAVEWKRPHIRTPGYVYGVTGMIERVCGRHSDPSFLAFGVEAPTVQLYRVRFHMSDIWPEYHGSDSKDEIQAEIYEHWLERSDEETHTTPQGSPVLFDHSGQNDGCLHSHSHDDSHHDHVHDARPSVEERAIQREGPPRPGQELFQALLRLLLDKSIITEDEVRSMCERMDTAGMQLMGAELVVQAWLDPSFQERLLEDAASAAQEIGISTSNPNAPTVLTVMANTPETHNVVVCTLCSCYPSGLLGIAPSWYKSREYRARAVREPRVVLRDFGLTLPEGKRIHVHDSTADHRYIVLPERPQGTEGWSREQLKKIVTRDSMIGIAVPSILE